MGNVLSNLPKLNHYLSKVVVFSRNLVDPLVNRLHSHIFGPPINPPSFSGSGTLPEKKPERLNAPAIRNTVPECSHAFVWTRGRTVASRADMNITSSCPI